MNIPNTIEDFTSVFREELKDHYPKEEIDAIAFLTVSNLFGISRDEMRIQKEHSVQPKEAERIHFIIKELKTQKPIQYVLGRTDFYGCKIRVNEHVLIPRPETEELVNLILTEVKGNTNSPNRREINILDIGTGSGCIAIALKKNIAYSNVNALDISEESLLIAKVNAILNQTKISFLQADILNLTPQSPRQPCSAKVLRKGEKERGSYDIIVSNPPYVRISEKEKMSRNILDYEPHLALFVNDNNPLLFYNAIAEFAKDNLTPVPSSKGEGGKLYFEINELLGSEVKKLLEKKGFKNVEIKKDMNGKERFAAGNRTN